MQSLKSETWKSGSKPSLEELKIDDDDLRRGRVWVLSRRPSVVPCISLHIYFDTLTCHFTLSSRLLEIGCLQIMTLTTFQSLLSLADMYKISHKNNRKEIRRWDGNISKFDIQFIHNQYARMSVKFQSFRQMRGDVSINFLMNEISSFE